MPKTHDSGKEGYATPPTTPRYVFPAFWLIIFIGALTASGPWGGTHALVFGGAGLLMIAAPPSVALPRLWWALAACFLAFGLLSLLPAAWFGSPAWRGGLEAFGIHTGSQVAIQTRPALEIYIVYALLLFCGLWLAGHRASSSQVAIFALTFTVGVAIYAICAFFIKNTNSLGTYGFFPNRNHTGTYLALGAIVGLGVAVQHIREKKFIPLGVALVSTGICLWALIFLSISRGGLLAAVAGILLWLVLLGPSHMGKNGARAVWLFGLLVVGVFAIAETKVKQRFSQKIDTVETILASDQGNDPSKNSREHLDFRLPIALDTYDLIKDFPLTGVGAGQFGFVFPQYRVRSAIPDPKRVVHPESDWLWLISEYGIPGAAALAALVGTLAVTSCKRISKGHQRSVRYACLAGALTIGIHGIFDVPGHRAEMICAAALLFSLSLTGSRGDYTRRRPSRLLFRSAGAIVLLAGIVLAFSQSSGWPVIWRIRGEANYLKALQLHKQATPLHPESLLKDLDDLRTSDQIANETLQQFPLDRRFWQLKGMIGLTYTDVDPNAAFAAQEALDPYQIETLLFQATHWIDVDFAKSMQLWSRAMDLAIKLDQRNSTVYLAKTTKSYILNASNGRVPQSMRRQVRDLLDSKAIPASK